ncbi:hypothetical protein ACYOEI_11415 [Singulisphaera rosea]
MIFAVNKARNELIDIENLTEDQLNTLPERYTKVAELYREEMDRCPPCPGDEERHDENNKKFTF